MARTVRRRGPKRESKRGSRGGFTGGSRLGRSKLATSKSSAPYSGQSKSKQVPSIPKQVSRSKDTRKRKPWGGTKKLGTKPRRFGDKKHQAMMKSFYKDPAAACKVFSKDDKKYGKCIEAAKEIARTGFAPKRGGG